MPDAPSAFVTGGTGFLGSHLVEELLRRGYREVRCLVRRELRWLEGLNVVPVNTDLFDATGIRQAVAGVDYVFHAGAVTRSRSWEVFERENVVATLNLLDAVADAAPDVRRVVVTSSLAAVGQCDGGVADERTPLNPISRYGRSKAQMELSITSSRNGMAPYSEQLPFTVIRPSSVYGPREADIYTMFRSAQRGIFPMIGLGKEPDVSLIHVRDVVRGMVDAAESSATAGETYFLGSETAYSWREVHRAMAESLGRTSVALPVPARLIGLVGTVSEAAGLLNGRYPPLNREKAREIRRACKMCSIDRARAEFGFEQRISLEEGFRETVAWYRAHGWL